MVQRLRDGVGPARNGQLPGDDDPGPERDGDVHCHTVCPDGDGSRNGQRNGDEQSGGHQLSDDVYGELQQRDLGDADGHTGEWFNVCGMEWSLHRNRQLPGDDEPGPERDGDVHCHTVCPDGDGSRNGQRNGDEQSGGHQLSDDMYGELQQRDPGDADGHTGERFNVCGMEWGLHRNGQLPGDDDPGTQCNGDVQREWNRGASDLCDCSRPRLVFSNCPIRRPTVDECWFGNLTPHDSQSDRSHYRRKCRNGDLQPLAVASASYCRGRSGSKRNI